MIGFGSPTDKLRESVIVLMVSPLALRFVIDHNTEQRMEFRTFSTTTAPGPVGTVDRTSASNPCGESMQAMYSRTTAERIVRDSEPLQVDVLLFFRPSQGWRQSPVHTHAASQALLRPHF